MKLSEPEKIEAFKETYDALYIEDLSDEKKEEIKETVNPVLKQLIDRLQFPKTYNVDIIEGPISFYKLMLNRKSFYLFGEKHKDTRGHCLPMDSISFSEYIKRLSENSPSFFDLYIELSMFSFSKPKTEGDLSHYDISGIQTSQAISDTLRYMLYSHPNHDFITIFTAVLNQRTSTVTSASQIMNDITRDFLECLQPSTREVFKCQRMRIHNINVRTSWNPDEIYDDLYLIVIHNILIMNIDFELKLSVLRRLGDKAIEVLSNLIDTGKMTGKNIMDITLTNKYVDKELSKVDDNMRVKIIDFFIDKYQSLCNLTVDYKIGKLISYMKESRHIPFVLPEYFEPVVALLMNISSLSVDMYCLSRVFKRYNSRIVGNRPLESSNIFIYAGDRHIEICREFLKHIGSLETYSYQNPKQKSCVSIRDNLLTTEKYRETELLLQELMNHSRKQSEKNTILSLQLIGIVNSYKIELIELMKLHYGLEMGDREYIDKIEQLKRDVVKSYEQAIRNEPLSINDIDDDFFDDIPDTEQTEYEPPSILENEPLSINDIDDDFFDDIPDTEQTEYEPPSILENEPLSINDIDDDFFDDIPDTEQTEYEQQPSTKKSFWDAVGNY